MRIIVNLYFTSMLGATLYPAVFSAILKLKRTLSHKFQTYSILTGQTKVVLQLYSVLRLLWFYHAQNSQIGKFYSIGQCSALVCSSSTYEQAAAAAIHRLSWRYAIHMYALSSAYTQWLFCYHIVQKNIRPFCLLNPWNMIHIHQTLIH